MPRGGDFGGPALPHLRLDVRIDEDAELRLPEEVDEAGSDDVPLRVDGRRGRRLRQIADGDDRVAAHPDVAAEPRRARAVEDAPIDDLAVERRLSGRAQRRTASSE